MAMESKNKAMITACEKNRIRVDKLKYNIERQGAKGINVMLEDARKLSDFFSFDKILLDAPCSGSGTLNIRKVASPDVQVASQPHESRKLNLVAPKKSCDFSYAIKIKNENINAVFSSIIYIGLFLLSTASLVSDTYNPFLYFRF